MKIGFDAKRLFFNSTGLGNYSRQWVEALMGSNHAVECHLYASRYAKFENLTAHTPDFKKNPNQKSLLDSFWRTYKMGLQAESDGCEIFHGLSNEIPMGKSNIPRVCTIHDVIFKEFPKYYSWIDRQLYDLKTGFACKNAEALIVTSETTKRELQKYYSVDEGKIHVIYQTVDSRFTNASWAPNLENPYILYYSSFNLRKNHLKLIESFAKIANETSYNLILAGKGREKDSILATIQRLGMERRIILTESPTNDELLNLLVYSSGFIYPSLQEGFGIPLVEAANVGIPMVVSDIPIFRELSGNAALAYFNPNDIDDIASGILKLTKAENSGTTDYSDLLNKTNIENMLTSALNVYRSLL